MKLQIFDTGPSAAQDSNPEEIKTHEVTSTIAEVTSWRVSRASSARKENPSRAWGALRIKKTTS